MITANRDVQKTKKSLSKIIERITTDLKNHQSEMINCNRKLNFYSQFKTDETPSNSLLLMCLGKLKVTHWALYIFMACFIHEGS